MTDETASIRAASANDVDAVMAVFIASRHDAMAYLPVLYTPAEIRFWIGEIMLKQHEVFVAAQGDDITGFVAMTPSTVDHLYILPNEQGRGLGSTLLRIAKERAAQGLRLNVFQRNDRAREFYEWHGFQLVELRDGSQNEEREPDAVYAWRRET